MTAIRPLNGWYIKKHSLSDDEYRVSLESPSRGIRLLSHRPSVLSKIEQLVGRVSGLKEEESDIFIVGSDWERGLKQLLEQLSASERGSVLAVSVIDPEIFAIPAEMMLTRARSDWFPQFVSNGSIAPFFQPIVDFKTGETYGYEAMVRGKLGAVELTGADLFTAAEAFDAIFSFDNRCRVASLEIGLSLLEGDEVLFVNYDTRALVDVEASLRVTWPVIEEAKARPSSVCLELVHCERCSERGLLSEFTQAHRERGALISLDDMSGSVESLKCMENLRPDIVKIDTSLTDRIDRSPARRRLVEALVDCAHEQGSRVAGKGIESDTECENILALGFDLGQGFYFGQPNARPLPVDERLICQKPVAR